VYTDKGTAQIVRRIVPGSHPFRAERSPIPGSTLTKDSTTRGVRAAIAAGGGIQFLVPLSPVAHAQVDSAAIVPGTLVQGTVKASLTGGSYANQNANLGDWPLNTGGTASDTYAISYENPDCNGNAFGGNANTMIAFGNGGGVTLQFATPITPHAGEKDLGIGIERNSQRGACANRIALRISFAHACVRMELIHHPLELTALKWRTRHGTCARFICRNRVV
jgi:hypothetical protein